MCKNTREMRFWRFYSNIVLLPNEISFSDTVCYRRTLAVVVLRISLEKRNKKALNFLAAVVGLSPRQSFEKKSTHFEALRHQAQSLVWLF